MNSLERNKSRINPLLNEINALDSATYGGQNTYNQNLNSNNYYGSLPKSSPKYNSLNKYDSEQVLSSTYNNANQHYFEEHYASPKPYYPTNAVHTTNVSPKPYSNIKEFSYDLEKPYVTPIHSTKQSDYLSTLDGGYSTTAFGSNTYKFPDGQKTDTYMYKAYESSSQPTTTYSSDIQTINELPVLKDTDTLEQRMLKKSVTQQITEKRTVSMVKSSRQESSSKTFRFD